MKRLLTIILTALIIAGFSNAAFAYPSSVTVTCDFFNGVDCTNSDVYPSFMDPADVEHGVTEFFEAGEYIFSVDSGAWDTSTARYIGNLDKPDLWLWSMTIFQSGDTRAAGEMYYELGDYNHSFSTDVAALNNAISTNPSVTITLEQDGELFFFIDDFPPGDDGGYVRDNGGSVTITASIVPEPISSALFIVGGTLLAGRRFIKRKKAAL
jgi:hypothetical protein